MSVPGLVLLALGAWSAFSIVLGLVVALILGHRETVVSGEEGSILFQPYDPVGRVSIAPIGTPLDSEGAWTEIGWTEQDWDWTAPTLEP